MRVATMVGVRRSSVVVVGWPEVFMPAGGRNRETGRFAENFRGQGHLRAWNHANRCDGKGNLGHC
jgi:hypothetical protein